MKCLKYSKFEDVVDGKEDIQVVKLTKAAIATADKNYILAEELHDYYVKKTGYCGKSTKKSTAQAILKLFKTHAYEILRACVDNYAKCGVDPRYVYSPVNFFGRFDADKAYYREYISDAYDGINKTANKNISVKRKPTFRDEVGDKDDLLEMPV